MSALRFSSSDGTPLCADAYEPEAPAGTPLPPIVIVHGYFDHRGRYRHVARFLAGHGYRVVAGDLRGHGESGGPRAYVERLPLYLDDIQAFLGQTGSAPGQAPILIGHSLGGLLALRFALDRPAQLRAVVLSSPFLGLKVKVPAWKRRLGQLASIVYPTLALPSDLDPAHLSHDPAVAPAYTQDPLVTSRATARWFTEALLGQNDVLARAPTLRVPILVLQAADDRIADPAASQAVFDRLGGPDKTMISYPGLFHEIFNEVDKDRVLADLHSWLKKH